MSRNRNTLIITLLYGVLPGLSFVVLRLIGALIFGQKIGFDHLAGSVGLLAGFSIFGLILGIRVADRKNLK